MITNEWIFGTEDISVPMALRREVFCAEQGVAECDEEDQYDELALHLVIYDGDTPVATGRVYHNGKVWRIGRCCVKKDVRGQGIGDLLLKMLLLKAFQYNPSKVEIDAQTHAQQFYERYGFMATGEAAILEGLPHVPMRVTKETLRFPGECGEVRRYEDFFKADE